MKIEIAIANLIMENELMQFDPMTGEDYPIELQNRDNQDLYKANLIAIQALEKQIELNGYLNTLRKNKKYQIYDILSEFALEVENMSDPCRDCSCKYYCDKDCWQLELYIEKLKTEDKNDRRL